jgi:dienelactone hydrolase
VGNARSLAARESVFNPGGFRASRLRPTMKPKSPPAPAPASLSSHRPFAALAAFAALAVFAAAPVFLFAAESAGDRMTAEYFRAETARVAAQSLAEITTLRDWTERRAGYREELFEMFGLSPRPEKTELRATITGRLEHEKFFVEKLHFQSLPGLYVTADLYVPKNLAGRAPAILYACGHGQVKEGGVSMGNKTSYQHHGAWFASHGYVCLMLDTIQLGELEGAHHGTRRLGMFWWNSRGYTPAGVEAWNCLRALDYLETRPEVDAARLGMTGRSGGGAYTWSAAALDDRIKVAVPVAGITDLHNHVIDGTVKGHCDCMFQVNTYRWDFSKLAALLAPRPLLIANSDKDTIFPLDGVLRVHRDVARIYGLHNASDQLGLLITEGPHKDTQDLQVPAFRWFNRWLKGEPDTLIADAAEKKFKPAELRVFPPKGEPADERTTKIHETFVPLAAPAVPANAAAWARQREEWRRALREKVFRGWPKQEEGLQLARLAAAAMTTATAASEPWEFQSQDGVRLSLDVRRPTGGGGAGRKKVRLQILERDEPLAVGAEDEAVVRFFPRGFGPTASTLAAADQNEVRRRYMLLGQTIDGMRVWDIRRAVAALRATELFGDAPITLVARGEQGINALYASLFIDGLAGVELIAPPASHMGGPDYLNVLRFLDVPQTAAMALERQPVKFSGADPDRWSWTTRAAQVIGRAASWAVERGNVRQTP